MKTKATKRADLTDKVPAVVNSNSKTAVPQDASKEKVLLKLGLDTPLPEPKDADISSIPIPLALGAIILMIFLPLLQTDLWWLRGSIAWAVLACKALTIVKAIAVIISVFYKLDLKGLTHIVHQTRGKGAPDKAVSALGRTKASESLHASVVLALAACCMPWVGDLARAVFGDVRQQGMYLGAFVWMYPYTNVVLELFNRCAVLSGVLLVSMKLPRWLKTLSFDELYRVCISSPCCALSCWPSICQAVHTSILGCRRRPLNILLVALGACSSLHGCRSDSCCGASLATGRTQPCQASFTR